MLTFALALSLSAAPNPAVEEANKLLKAVHTAQRAYFAEFDRYSADPNAIGFEPQPCDDGSSASAREGGVAGCKVVIKLTASGVGENAVFTATAKGKGVALGIDSKSAGEIKQLKR